MYADKSIDVFEVPNDKSVLGLLTDYIFINKLFKSKSDIKRIILQGGIRYFSNILREQNKTWEKIVKLDHKFDKDGMFVWLRINKKGDTYLFNMINAESYYLNKQIDKIMNPIMGWLDEPQELDYYLNLPEIPDDDYNNKLQKAKKALELVGLKLEH